MPRWSYKTVSIGLKLSNDFFVFMSFSIFFKKSYYKTVILLIKLAQTLEHLLLVLYWEVTGSLEMCCSGDRFEIGETSLVDCALHLAEGWPKMQAIQVPHKPQGWVCVFCLYIPPPGIMSEKVWGNASITEAKLHLCGKWVYHLEQVTQVLCDCLHLQDGIITAPTPPPDCWCNWSEMIHTNAKHSVSSKLWSLLLSSSSCLQTLLFFACWDKN